MAAARAGKLLRELFEMLLAHFGPQGWWPGETPFEVAVGAILTQNTNWNNVARVLANLKARGLLEPQALRDLPLEELAARLRPAGYYNIKAGRLRNFLDLLFTGYQGSLELMAAADPEQLREALLRVKGIGPETADSIMLYALDQPTFVVDAYTFRILSRHVLIPEACTYEELRSRFLSDLPAEIPLYQEYHAFFVQLGKEFCRPKPRCEVCPLNNWPEGFSGIEVA
jgi:endonuclease III related protein